MGTAKFCTSSRAAAAELVSHVIEGILSMRMSSTCTFYRSDFAHASVSECARECVYIRDHGSYSTRVLRSNRARASNNHAT